MARDIQIQSMKWDWRLSLLIVAGITSGVLSASMFDSDVHYARWHGPGPIYGLLIGGILYWLHVASLGRAFVFLFFSGSSFYAAMFFSYLFHFGLEDIGVPPFLHSGLNGLVSGALGAALLGGGTALLFPWFRRRGVFGVTVLLGGATGMLLTVFVYSAFPLFIAWQTAFAGCLAWGIATVRAPIEPSRFW